MVTKFFLFFVIFFGVSLTANAVNMGQVKTSYLITDKITTGVVTDAVIQPLGNIRTFHLLGNTSAGAGASVVNIEVSNDGTNWIILDAPSLTLGTAVTSDFYESSAAWRYVRGNVVSISGTDAKVSLIIGAQL
jgi:hypothetical protein